MNEFETIVIGNGLFGSAATHYLSDISQNVAVIRVAEPADQTTHDGVFASHYDQRQLLRRSVSQHIGSNPNLVPQWRQRRLLASLAASHLRHAAPGQLPLI
jgi:glycine/D-amino acid oxidase-like deaminating enzyme